MNYEITRVVLGSKAAMPISVEQFEEIKKSKLVLLHALNLEQKFDFVIENFLELEATLLESALHGMVLGGQDHAWYSGIRSKFDRRIMNFLTTGRSYSDSAKHHLNRIFERGSTEVGEVMACLSGVYDSHLGYRAMYELRNVIQHQGLAVHGLTHHARWVDSDRLRQLTTIDPYILPNELLETEFKKFIIEQLQAIGDKVELKYLLRDYLDGLAKFHEGLRDAIKDNVNRAQAVLDEARSGYIAQCAPDQASVVGLAAVAWTISGRFEEVVDIVHAASDLRVSLQQKNRGFRNFSKRYVSSETSDGMESES